MRRDDVLQALTLQALVIIGYWAPVRIEALQRVGVVGVGGGSVSGPQHGAFGCSVLLTKK